MCNSPKLKADSSSSCSHSSRVVEAWDLLPLFTLLSEVGYLTLFISCEQPCNHEGTCSRTLFVGFLGSWSVPLIPKEDLVLKPSEIQERFLLMTCPWRIHADLLPQWTTNWTALDDSWPSGLTTVKSSYILEENIWSFGSYLFPPIWGALLLLC